jgi:hypothetical protein
MTGSASGEPIVFVSDYARTPAELPPIGYFTERCLSMPRAERINDDEAIGEDAPSAAVKSESRAALQAASSDSSLDVRVNASRYFVQVLARASNLKGAEQLLYARVHGFEVEEVTLAPMSAFEVRETAHKGFGLFAARDIEEKGTARMGSRKQRDACSVMRDSHGIHAALLVAAASCCAQRASNSTCRLE